MYVVPFYLWFVTNLYKLVSILRHEINMERKGLSASRQSYRRQCFCHHMGFKKGSFVVAFLH